MLEVMCTLFVLGKRHCFDVKSLAGHVSRCCCIINWGPYHNHQVEHEAMGAICWEQGIVNSEPKGYV